jgi:hypothetical protein
MVLRPMALDSHLHYGRYIFDADLLGQIQLVLAERAPKWCTHLRIADPPKTKVDVTVPGALFDVAAAEMTRVSDYSAQLERLFGTRADPVSRRVIELAGSSAGLTILIDLDSRIFFKTAGELHWGNSVALQVTGKRIDGVRASTWLRTVTKELIQRTAPWYGHVESREEFDAGNLIRDEDGVRAVGVDLRYGLPGIYWLNYFGEPFVRMIGLARLETTPAFAVTRLGSGVEIVLSSDPGEWAEADYRERRGRVVSHLGRSLFALWNDGEGAAVPEEMRAFL